MRARKLIPEKAILEIRELQEMGVPLARIIKDQKLDISYPHLRKLLELYEDFFISCVYNPTDIAIVTASMFPSWLRDSPKAQAQSKQDKYEGRFPFGRWISLNENN